ncbi:hypothetical protein B7P43_G02833 [Cryptotermes secundus]|uniref:Uncharacterized protein n=1 Tax=Cryptotermes secundus TaxID=105785 RepID=A0A2J7QU84_9NEOP|nr:hypothetical protein B7P43_G02833 [Cryptotermes secundus]
MSRDSVVGIATGYGLDYRGVGVRLWVYVKNIVYQVKIDDLQHLKACIRDAVAMATPNMVDRLDVCRATKGAHVDIY